MKQEAEEGLVFDPKTREWSGSLPDNCDKVRVQYLDRVHGWLPSAQMSVDRTSPRTPEEARALIEKPKNVPFTYKYEKYRLMPWPDTKTLNSEQETTTMATKKKATKKAATTPKAPAEKQELVAGRFRANSMDGRVLTLLADGKARSPEELVKACDIRSLRGMELRHKVLAQYGQDSGAFQLTKTDNGKWQMEVGGRKKATPKAGGKTASKSKGGTKKAADAKGDEGAAGVSVSA